MYQKPKYEKNSGFVALISVIIISAILLLIATSLSFSGFYARYNILDSEFKKRSSTIAEACVDVALLKLTTDTSYNPTNTIVAVGGDSCTIQSITTSGTNKTIYTRSSYKNYITNLKVVVNITNFSVVSWEELP